MAIVKIDALSPLALKWTVTPSDAVPSLADTIVTAAEFAFKRQDGTEGTWTATVSSQSATELVLSHLWEAGDVPNVETMRVWPVLTTTSGVVPCVGGFLKVEER